MPNGKIKQPPKGGPGLTVTASGRCVSSLNSDNLSAPTSTQVTFSGELDSYGWVSQTEGQKPYQPVGSSHDPKSGTGGGVILTDIPLPSETVYLQMFQGGKWVSINSTQTDPNGCYSFNVTSNTAEYNSYLVAFEGISTYPACESDVVTVTWWTPAPEPSGGLQSNINYFLEDGGKPLTGVTATVNFTTDFVSSENGYSFQLNCYSTEGANISTEWQQFVIYASPNSSQLVARIDTWSGTALSDELNRIDVALANMPSATIKAGYTFKIALTYTNDGTGTVTGANYTVTDEFRNPLGTANITIVEPGSPSHNLRTTNKPATAANLAPIAAFQYDIGGDYGCNTATLTSGAGTITYTATNQLSVVNAEPNYTDFDDGTAENANLVFCPLPTTASQVFTQGFAATPPGSMEHRVTRRGHGLPPPDDRSRTSPPATAD